jgi:DNA replication protein DnaC
VDSCESIILTCVCTAMKLFACSDDANKNLVLSGISGIGKSAVLAAAAARLKKVCAAQINNYFTL